MDAKNAKAAGIKQHIVYFDNEDDDRDTEMNGTEINIDIRMQSVRGTNLLAKIINIRPKKSKQRVTNGVETEESIIVTA